MPIPLPVIPNAARVALRWTAGAQTAVNVIHMGGVTDPASAADAFEALQDAVTQDMWGPVNAGAVVTQVDITPLDGSSATQSFLTGATAQWTGETGGDFVPAVASVIKFQTLLRGRANRGRVFLPFISESAISDGMFTAGAQLVVQNAWTACQTALEADTGPGGPWALLVASYDRKHGGAGAHATTIATFTAEVACATQRRRQSRLR